MNPCIKLTFITITLCAVIFDSLLVPFYPEFFKRVFDITDPKVTGYYLSTATFIVMIALPLWARLSKRIDTLKLLVATQMASAFIALLCFYNQNFFYFCLLSIGIFLFKSSYLLLYPYILKTEPQSNHESIIGLLAAVLHIGIIVGTLLGGIILEKYDPLDLFLLMAAGDMIQTALCLLLLRLKKETATNPTVETTEITEYHELKIENPIIRPKHFLWILSACTCLFYFSILLPRPFFAQYWQAQSAIENTLLSAAVFSITAITAIGALVYNHFKHSTDDPREGIIIHLTIAALGLILQAYAPIYCIIIGRVLFGWGLFQAMVKLDRCLFYFSSRRDYEKHYGIVHFFQGAGSLLAAFFSGIITAAASSSYLFILSAGFFILTALLFKTKMLANNTVILNDHSLNTSPSLDSSTVTHAKKLIQ